MDATIAGLVRITPGKRLYQVSTFPELGCQPGESASLQVRALQRHGGRLEARVRVLGIDSADGSWTPAEFGCPDTRTFSRHGRGELVVRASASAQGPQTEGTVTVSVPALVLETRFSQSKESASEHTNAVALLVEFANIADQGTVTVWAPTLTKGEQPADAFSPGRSVPTHYRRLPRTMGKLLRREPVHILALGSSIDTGDANPRLYLYDEDPQSPTYKQPLWNGAFNGEALGQPELNDYLGAAKQYVKYTGRMRRKLMRTFNLPVSDIMINAMSCGGSSIGESHSGLATYSALEWPPGPQNGHPTGQSWARLYPRLFADGDIPPPDLVIFGHGHNERIDSPDGIAVYEGAIRWFQKRFPEVEFLFCQWHRSRKSGNIPPIPVREALCEHYGIPFVNIVPIIEELTGTWCNLYALCPDGGHPQAAAHDLWFRQLAAMFEIADPVETFIPQKHLPERFNPYAYGWEGNVVTYQAPHPRIRGSRMIIDDTAFNLWCGDGQKDWMTLRIDGQHVGKGPAGNGRQMTRRDPRNSSFVHGRLALGERHIIEVMGNGEVEVVALDCKQGPTREVLQADNPAWICDDGVAEPVRFESEWGAPFGDTVVILQAGQSMGVTVTATALGVAYVDEKSGGTLEVSIDGEPVDTWSCDQPFVDSDGIAHFMENRRGIRGLPYSLHTVTLRAAKAPVKILGMTAYDAR